MYRSTESSATDSDPGLSRLRKRKYKLERIFSQYEWRVRILRANRFVPRFLDDTEIDDAHSKDGEEESEESGGDDLVGTAVDESNDARRERVLFVRMQRGNRSDVDKNGRRLLLLKWIEVVPTSKIDVVLSSMWHPQSSLALTEEVVHAPKTLLVCMKYHLPMKTGGSASAPFPRIDETLQLTGKTYTLHAVVWRDGLSQSAGHFKVFSRNDSASTGTSWTVFDDERVSRISSWSMHRQFGPCTGARPFLLRYIRE